MFYKGLKYLSQGAAIYLIFRFLPELLRGDSKLSNKDIFIITIVLMLIYILFENLCVVFSKKEKPECESFCNRESFCKDSNSMNSEAKIEKLFDKLEKLFNSKCTQEESCAYQNPRQIDRTGSRPCDGLVDDDMKYTDYNHIPIGEGLDSLDYEYGYSYLPPSQWYPTPPFPPVCVSEKKNPVIPMNTTGTPVDMKEWNDSRKILQPDRINTNYVKQLNAGR